MSYIDNMLKDEEYQIKQGDIVYAVFTHNDIFNEMSSCKIRCKIISTPGGPGDVLDLYRLDNEQPLVINANSTEFVGLEFIERPSHAF